MSVGLPLMITIRATSDEIDIAGSLHDLDAVRTSIERFTRANERSVSIAATLEADPAPYQYLLRELQIVRAGGPTRVSVVGTEVLLVSGSVENLVRFASWFNFRSDAQPGDHHHHDCSQGDPFVASDSLSLVVSVSSEAAQQFAAGNVRNGRA